MEVEVRKHRTSAGWREVYTAALFEDDGAKIRERIIEAEEAIAERALELVSTNEGESREKQAIENARHFLKILGQVGVVNTPTLTPMGHLSGIPEPRPRKALLADEFGPELSQSYRWRATRSSIYATNAAERRTRL